MCFIRTFLYCKVFCQRTATFLAIKSPTLFKMKILSETVWPAITLFSACVPPESIALRWRGRRHYKGMRLIFWHFWEIKYPSWKTLGSHSGTRQAVSGRHGGRATPGWCVFQKAFYRDAQAGTPLALHWHMEDRRKPSVFKRKELFCTKLPSLPMFPKRD